MPSNFPKVETLNLILDQIDKRDSPTIVEILQNEIYSKNAINIPFP